MLLKRIELAGFKSFVQRTIIEIRDGITVIVGPNGCGKSNIIDAVRWVFGEQSPRSLRISQHSELLFNGSKAHAAVNFAEVSIVFDNGDNALKLDIAEVAITRRLYRNGDGGYYLNDRPVQLKDIRALFSNLGIGFSPYSILEQGRTDQILVAKPDVKREIFEEAAGIRGYRVKFAESNRKLLKVEQQMEAIRPVLQEIERTYHNRQEQWKRLQSYRELSKQRTELLMQQATAEYQRLEEQRARRTERRDQLQKKHSEAIERDEQRRRDSRQFQQQLEKIRKAQEQNRDQMHEKRIALERGRGGIDRQRERISQIEHSIAEQSRLMSDSFTQIELMTAQQKQLEGQVVDAERARAVFQREYQKLQQEQRTLRERRSLCIEARKKNEQVIVSHEKKQRQLRAQMVSLSQKIVEQIDQLLSEQPTMSVNTIIDDPQLAELAQKNAHLITLISTALNDYHTIKTDSPSIMQQVIEQITTAIAALQESHQQYTRARDLQLKTITPLFTLLTDPKSDFAARHQLDREYARIQEQVEQQRREAQHTASEQSEIEQRLQKLADHLKEGAVENERQRMHIQNMTDKKRQFLQQIGAKKSEQNRLHDRVSAYRDQQTKIQKEITAAEQHLKQWTTELSECKKQDQSFVTQLERVRKSIGTADQQSEKNRQQLQQLRTQLDSARDAYSTMAAKIEFAARQFRDQFGSDITHYQSAAPASDTTDQRTHAVLSTEIQKLTAHISQLGRINMMAHDEFIETESRYQTMNKHYQDLIEAQQNLAQVTEEINRQSSERLTETVAAIAVHFREICEHFFTESNGSISLATPEKPLESDVLIMIQPQGKKNEKIEHLSGGERVMGSLALLFALYRHSPSHVTFLDEVDAALDEDNVVRVAHYIRDHLQSTQSIIITHNRQTVSVATSIVGITMERYGISKALEIAVQDYL